MNRLFANCLLTFIFSGLLLAQNGNPSPATPLAQNVTAQTDQEIKRAEIRKLIELTGAANVSTDALRQVIAPLRASFPQVPDEFWDTFMKEVRADDLIDLIVPIYDATTRGTIYAI